MTASGPLAGFRVLEFEGIGPGPWAGMMLSDMGADVVRVERLNAVLDPIAAAAARTDALARGRRAVALDLKSDEGRAAARRLMASAHAVIEGFRPGVMERLGLGPDDGLAVNPALVYGRMTGWGQDGPLAQMAGHDIDYIAITGALHSIGPGDGPPVPPLNLVGDFGGGGLLLAFGVVCALLEASRSGRGQVVDAAMVDGASLLMGMTYSLKAAGLWVDARGSNLLDGGAPYYGTYETADGRHMAVGAMEPQFFAELVRLLEISPEGLPDRNDPKGWPQWRRRFDEVFRSRTQAAWVEVFTGTDACVMPVLSLTEAPDHPHIRARKTYVEANGFVQPAPAPRFSRTPAAIQPPAEDRRSDTDAMLRDWGFAADEIVAMRADGRIG